MNELPPANQPEPEPVESSSNSVKQIPVKKDPPKKDTGTGVFRYVLPGESSFPENFKGGFAG